MSSICCFPLCDLITNFLITFQTCPDSSIEVGHYRFLSVLLTCPSAQYLVTTLSFTGIAKVTLLQGITSAQA